METPLEVEVGRWLRQRGFKLATAESCTGGLIGHWVTNVPGSSDYYLGGVSAYSYEAKTRLLGVPQGLLAQYGAVSRETALEMARGIRQALGNDFPIERIVSASVTGIAGPGGGLPGKPVGLVWTGLSTPEGDWAYSYTWPYDRVGNKEASARQALALVISYLQGHVPPQV